MKKKIIAIIGMMATGKTTIGAKLARKLNYYFIDCDSEIEDREGQSIREIFAKKGEEYFRLKELEVAEEILSRSENIVFSLGGGAFMNEKIRSILLQKAITLWFYASTDEIIKRVGFSTARPLLNSSNKKDVIASLIEQRYPTYSMADLHFDTGASSHEILIQNIVKELYRLEFVSKVMVYLKERSYNIIIGNNIFYQLAIFLARHKYSKIFVISDDNVSNHYENRILAIAKGAKMIVIRPGEQSKSFRNMEMICDILIESGVDRKSLIIAFGGGVVGDLAGFLASVTLRGIDFIQVPTTLLAAVDSSVGGKTAINSSLGKNLIGSFYQPKLVLCDLALLKTLPLRELRSGYAEILKYALIYDYDFFEFLRKNYKKLFDYDEEILKFVITRSCQIKAQIVGEDERESSKRALLNFGHTFGHIFETETNYSGEILHGEAVALGMVMASTMSYNFGLISEKQKELINNHILEAGFIIDPLKIRGIWDEDNLIRHLYKDKKNEEGKLTFILLCDIGKAIIKKDVHLDEFRKVLHHLVPT